MASHLKDKNYEVILFDIQGHGKSEGKRGDAASINAIYNDINLILKQIKSKNVYLGGHSSGAGLALNYSSWNNKSNIEGYVFIAPEFGYKSETAKKQRVDFARVETYKFIANAMSGGKAYAHDYADHLNYPPEILKSNPDLITGLTVTMANALTPQRPQEQFKAIKEPIALFIGEKDEVFDVQKVLNYKNFSKNNKSLSEEIPNATHLSILGEIAEKLVKMMDDWNVK